MPPIFPQATSEPLSPERLAEIAARATTEGLTPGPWRLDREQCDCSDGYCHHGAYVTGVVTPVPTEIAAEGCKRTGEKPRDYDFHRSEVGDFPEADWELMAHAREDLPALLAEVERLTAERDRYRHAWRSARGRAVEANSLTAGLDDLAALVSSWHKRAETAEAEADRLTARVAELETERRRDGQSAEMRHLLDPSFDSLAPHTTSRPEATR